MQVPYLDKVIGESIAVNGICLTLVPEKNGMFAFDVSPETLQKTNFGQLQPGDSVHLERALLASDRFGGHYVSGHVDKTAVLLATRQVDDYLEMMVGGFEECDNIYLLPKGSITLDGVSLTINDIKNTTISLMLVPHTLAHTSLGQKPVGYEFNVEFDYLTKIVAHQLRCKEVHA